MRKKRLLSEQEGMLEKESLEGGDETKEEKVCIEFRLEVWEKEGEKWYLVINGDDLKAG
ncbi:hypothetical protein FACS189472_16430 [Alphaproteobacteria bacterium]|nr:hypothetical protein FACS189472_16430 [Alphaproteobacteria bacterium]